MNDFREYPKALSPIYHMAEPNQPITLYEGKIEIGQGTKRASGDGKIQVKWFPNPSNRFEVELEENPISFDMVQKIKVIPESLGVELQGTVTHRSLGTKRSIGGYINSNSEIGNSSSVKSVIFHLANFWDFYGDIVLYGEEEFARKGFRQETKDFLLTIHGVRDLKEILEKLDNVGGYAFTHVAKLEKKIGVFSNEEIKDILRKLHTYFSLLRGLHTAPYLIVGYDENHEKTCEFWNAGMLQSAYRSVLSHPSWFPLDLNGLDGKIFESYLDLVSNGSWYEVISKSISWYVESRLTTFREQSILWSQICIELLSWASFVELNPHVTKTGFNSLDLGNRLRLLISTFDIPLNIPLELPELAKVAKGYSWDGPQAVSEIRNGIAHPNLRERLDRDGWKVVHEVRRLSIWYAELTILKQLNYRGDYHNSLKSSFVMEKEPVPWLSKG